MVHRVIFTVNFHRPVRCRFGTLVANKEIVSAVLQAEFFPDFIQFSGRGTLGELPTFVGTPNRVADQMEEWFTSEACDGFVIAATHMPGAYEDFVNLVVPELQRRKLFRTEYQGNTLRENLGLKPHAGGV